MLDVGRASGIYFALPTQLTSNKIFERFSSFLEKILDSRCKHRSLLLHANAWLYETEMGEEGRPGGAWFNQAKRGLLAPLDRKSTRLNSSHVAISYAVFCLKKKKEARYEASIQVYRVGIGRSD